MKTLFNHLLHLFLIIFSFFSCTAQKFSYKKIVDVPTFINSYNENTSLENLIKKEKPIDITKYLPKNHKKDGSIDYTQYIQKGINENRSILLPNFPILINDKGLDILNNSVVIFNKKSFIKLAPSAKTNYQILRIHQKQNIKIYSPRIEGDRNNHLNSKGEWGMGISIVSSTNIEIINPQIKNCWGDGIYLGQDKKEVNKNIKIKHGLIDNNRRNGISVISADGLEISDIILSNTNGTSPESGLDFEPNNNNEELKNITVKNIYTFNNKTNGIVFYLARLRGNKQKNVSIEINNHKDKYSLISLGYSSTEVKTKNNNFDPLNGTITLKNIDSYNSKYPFRVYKGTLNENININLHSKNKSKYNTIINDSGLKKIKISNN